MELGETREDSIVWCGKERVAVIFNPLPRQIKLAGSQSHRASR
jgi:hypothetical protein